jgi:hypothetical protein
MSLLSSLKSLARMVTPLAMDIYDREDQSSILNLIARVLPNLERERSGTLEWVAVFPELRRWVDERTSQGAFTGSLKWEGQDYEATVKFNPRDAERASSLVKVNELGTAIANAFVHGKVLLAISPLRNNEVAPIDGQDFFDVDHRHPNGTAYSNLLTVPRDEAANPTIIEARNEVKAARQRLIRNRLIRNTLAKAGAVEKSLIVFTKSDAAWQAYDDLLTEERIGGDINRFRGTFTLIRDYNPKPGTENAVDFVWAEEGGPRPVIFIPTREPNGVDFDESQVFSHKLIDMGMDAEYAVTPAFPQTACRIQP